MDVEQRLRLVQAGCHHYLALAPCLLLPQSCTRADGVSMSMRETRTTTTITLARRRSRSRRFPRRRKVGPSMCMEMRDSTTINMTRAMVERIGTTRTTTRVVTIISTKMHAREDTRTLRRKTHDGMRAVPGSK